MLGGRLVRGLGGWVMQGAVVGRVDGPSGMGGRSLGRASWDRASNQECVTAWTLCIRQYIRAFARYLFPAALAAAEQEASLSARQSQRVCAITPVARSRG